MKQRVLMYCLNISLVVRGVTTARPKAKSQNAVNPELLIDDIDRLCVRHRGITKARAPEPELVPGRYTLSDNI